MEKKCLKPPTSIQVMMWTVFYKTDEFSPLFAIGSNYNRNDCLGLILQRMATLAANVWDPNSNPNNAMYALFDPAKFWDSTRYKNHVTVQTQLPNLHALEICKQNDELLYFCLSKLPSWGSHPRFWLWSPICCWWNSSFAHQITMFAA
jgi:hypothetical protein